MRYRINVPAIRAQMGSKELNISNLAKKMGVSRETVANVLHGGIPSYDVMRKMASSLEMDSSQAANIFFA